MEKWYFFKIYFNTKSLFSVETLMRVIVVDFEIILISFLVIFNWDRGAVWDWFFGEFFIKSFCKILMKKVDPSSPH
jgi:hypothetical protein